MGNPLCVMFCFPLLPLIFALCLIFANLINMCLGVFRLEFILFGTLGFLGLGGYFLPHFREVFNYYLFKYFLMPFLFVFFFWDIYDSNVGIFNIVLEVSAAAAAAAKSLQSCLTLCDPIDGNPLGLLRPWDSPSKNTGVDCHFLLQCMKVKSESEIAQSATLSDPMDCSLPSSSVHGIFQARVLEWGPIAFSDLDQYVYQKQNQKIN